MPLLSKDSLLPQQFRSCEIVRREQTQEQRDAGEPALYEITVSTESPVERWFGNEILSHDKKAIDMTRFKRGAAVLIDHGYGIDGQVGVVERAWVDEEKRKLKAEIRFSKSTRGKEIEQDVIDGVRQNISVGYFVRSAKLTETGTDGVETWTVTRWEPAEVSIVSVPADVYAGIGRSKYMEGKAEFPVEIETDGEPAAETTTSEKRETMPEPIVTPAAPTAEEINSGEQKRADDIRGLCKGFGSESLAASFIASTISVAEVAARLQEAKKTQGVAQPAAEALARTVGTEMKRYSLQRAIMQKTAEMENTGKFDGFEAEVHQEMERLVPQEHKRNGGFFVPYGIGPQHRTTLDSLTPTKGTEAVPELSGALIPLLYPRARVIEAGANVITGISGPISFPRETAGATVYWVSENPSQNVPDGEPALGLITVTPRTIQGNIPFTRQLLQQASFGIDAWARNKLEIGHGLAIDLAAIHGTSNQGQPTGIYSWSGVNSSDFTGTAPASNGTAYGKLMEMVSKIHDKNADVDSMSWLGTPLLAGKLAATGAMSTTPGSTDVIWQGKLNGGTMLGYTARTSTQVSKTLTTTGQPGGTNCHGLVFGNWSDLLIFMFGGLEVVVDPYSNKKKGIIEVTTFQMCDIMIQHGESFSKAINLVIA